VFVINIYMKRIKIGIVIIVILCMEYSAHGQFNKSLIAVIDPIGYLKSEPTENSKTLNVISLGDSIIIDATNYSKPYFKAQYKGSIGYISVACLSLSCDVMDILQVNTGIRYLRSCDNFLEANKNEVHSNSNIAQSHDCYKTSNCGCSGKNKSNCGGPCCKWVVGTGCVCN